MKNSNDTIGNRTRDLPTCSAVPQPTQLPHAPRYSHTVNQTKSVNVQASEILVREMSFDGTEVQLSRMG